ncbi:DUF2278 family protein [Zavarzinella formosa]|uniref:DUF2278 family protein n=1 Tax=Zavarzinella formosa TaxID=360055 RepID=UPI000319C275|nr:DUF2278 family protein [Zavarzinella formosa]
MSVIYGVLRGKLDRWKREDVAPGSKKSPHLQIRLLGEQGHPWRIPVNVRSEDKTKSLVIFHRADPLLSHPIIDGLGLFPTGLTDLNNKPRTVNNSLDYFRAPLFDWVNGVALPPSGSGPDDDLQDVVSRYLQNLKTLNGELFAFGSHWHDNAPKPGIDKEFGTVNGMHDIHMNQGNAAGDHSDDNGSHNDGGLILKFPDRLVGLFFRFKTQFLPTDDKGNRTATAREIPPGSTPGSSPPSGNPTDPRPDFPPVYIERALVNPVGDDVGKEIVVLGSTIATRVVLSGWSIVDKGNRAEKLNGQLLPAGGSVSVVLSGDGAQLSNKGGTIRLVNPAGDIVHAVSYSQADAVEGSYVRFNT